MEDARVITMYLPQFHRVKENDEWWGEGFTEWTAVRKAKPLFKGHYQPREPQGSNYYDLLEKAAMKWQADLMHTYGVDAQCIYHYWFKDGRQILENPAENLLSWKCPFAFAGPMKHGQDPGVRLPIKTYGQILLRKARGKKAMGSYWNRNMAGNSNGESILTICWPFSVTKDI